MSRFTSQGNDDTQTRVIGGGGKEFGKSFESRKRDVLGRLYERTLLGSKSKPEAFVEGPLLETSNLFLSPR